MLLLAIDTCDSRGSVAVLRDEQLLANLRHEGREEYSLWLAPAVDRALEAAGVAFAELDVFAVTTGPGSFTGARIGLTAVKAWSEVYQKPIAGISRLEVLARQVQDDSGFAASFFDGSRNQIFAALYRRRGPELERVGEESVSSPEEFVRWVDQQTAGETVGWASLDPEKLTEVAAWKARAATGERLVQVTSDLAPLIGRIGYQRSIGGRLTDGLALDANYVRRTDAEVLWKAHGSGTGESK